MSIILAIALQLGAPQASADGGDFAARVMRGKLVEAGPTGPAYQKTLWAKLDEPASAALRKCIAVNAPADKSPFTLVAEVLPGGKTARVEAEPTTPVAVCFAGWLASMTLPVPPKLADGAYPIEIDVSIVP